MAEGGVAVEPRSMAERHNMARTERRRSLPPWRIALGVLRRAVPSFVEDSCSQHAAAISYFALFSLFPLVLLAAAVAGIVLRNEELQARVVEAIVSQIPVQAPSVASSLRALADLGPTLSVVSFFGALLSSSALATAVRSALDVCFSVQHGRPFVRAKLVDYVVVLLAGALFLSSTIVTTGWRIVQAQADRRFSIPEEQLWWLWSAGAFAIPPVLAFLTFLLLYRVLPHRAARLLHVWPGALVAAIAFELAKAGFATYVASFTNYQVVYGSLGGAIALLFWVYISANILLFGAEVSAEYGHVMRGEPRHGRAPLGGGDADEGDWRHSLVTMLRGLVFAPADNNQDDEGITGSR